MHGRACSDDGVSFRGLVTILAITRYATGFVDSASVVIGLVDLAKVGAAPWFDVIRPFHFGWPRFDLVSAITLCIVMIVVMIESTGMFLALAAPFR